MSIKPTASALLWVSEGTGSWGSSRRVKTPCSWASPHQPYNIHTAAGDPMQPSPRAGVTPRGHVASLGSGEEGRAVLLCLSTSLCPAGWAAFLCAAPDCLLFPGRHPQEQSILTPKRCIHFPTYLLCVGDQEPVWWGWLGAAEGEKGSVSCGGNVTRLRLSPDLPALPAGLDLNVH